MFRRKPTRIECKIDDLEEWQSMKKEKDADKKDVSQGSNEGLSCFDMDGDQQQSRREMVYRRIGYDPRPTNLQQLQPQTPQQSQQQQPQQGSRMPII